MPILIKNTLILFLLLSLPAAGSAWGQQPNAETQQRIEALQERVEELQIQETVLQSRIREVGKAETTEQGITNAQWRRDYTAQQIDKLKSIAQMYEANIADMERMHERLENQNMLKLEDIPSEAREQAGEKIARKGLEASGYARMGTVLGWAMIVGDLVDYGGRYVVRDINEDEMGEMVLQERIHMNDLLGVIVILSRERSDEVVRIQQLQELQKEWSDLQAELVPAKHQLASLTGHAYNDASTTRETDAAGDAKLQEEEERARQHIRIRPCGPARKRENFGVRLARKLADTSDKEKNVAEKDACIDITGRWTFQITHYLSPQPQPPQQIEIAAAESGQDDVQAYDIFMPAKKGSQNGPHMRCSYAGEELACRVRALPAKCPPDKQVWDTMNLVIAEDGESMSGEYTQAYAIDANADKSFCTAMPFEAPGKILYRFTPDQ